MSKNKRREFANSENITPETIEASQDHIPVALQNDESVAIVKDGVVTECLKLKLRTSPEALKDNSNVAAEIPVATPVKVFIDDSTEDFYNVECNGIIGYCMKQYIALSE